MTVAWNSSGLPMAITNCPGKRVEESPSFAGKIAGSRGESSALAGGTAMRITARSVCGSAPMSWFAPSFAAIGQGDAELLQASCVRHGRWSG